jgi:hypothetical protein
MNTVSGKRAKIKRGMGSGESEGEEWTWLLGDRAEKGRELLFNI